MNNIGKYLKLLGFVVIPSLFICTTGHLSGIEVTNGNCIGKIYNDDNTAAANALVRLIPSGYDPTIPSSGKIDSTYTQADGTYSFLVTKSDFYTVLGERENKFSKKDSVSILAYAKQDIGNDTLAEPACVTGHVVMKTGSDPSTAVILFTGTNFYTSPSDSSGYFDTIRLPQGRYTLKAFTTEDGYGLFDTSIVVFSEEHIELTITIPISFAPQIQTASVKYDTSTFQAAVSWQKVDSSQIMGYAIHRFVNNKEDTLVLLENYRGRYTDDCYLFYGDTITYKVAAVGKNFKEGYLTSTEPFTVCINAGIDYTIADQPCIRSLKTIGNECIGLTCNSSIIKIADDGSIQELLSKEQVLNISPSGISSIGLDSFNNIYAICERNQNSKIPVTVYKYDNSLNITDTLFVDDSTQSNIVTGSDGSLYFEYHNSISDSATFTKVKVYDSSFNFKNEFIFNQNITIKRCIKNRIMAIGYQHGNTSNKFKTTFLIMVFDSSFNLISSYDAKDPFMSDMICSQNSNGYSFDIISDHMYITEVFLQKYPYSIIILSDMQRNTCSKITMPPEFNYLACSSERLFGTINLSSRILFAFSFRTRYQ